MKGGKERGWKDDDGDDTALSMACATSTPLIVNSI